MKQERTRPEDAVTEEETVTLKATGETWTLREMRDWIDRQDHEGLLRWWRFAPSGDPFFQGEIGEHYEQALKSSRGLEQDRGASASKRVGWDPPGQQAAPRKP